MKRLLSYSAIAALALTLVACGNKTVTGNGNVTSQARQVSVFENMQVTGNFQVIVNNDTKANLAVVADTNIAPYIVTNVKEGKLMIAARNGYTLNPSQPIQIRVGMNNLKRLSAEGNSTIDVRSIRGDSFDMSILGNTKVILAGTTDQSTINMMGLTQLDAQNLLTKEMNLTVTGDSAASVYARNKLQVKITGNGQVIYYGKPPVINQAVYGKGKLLQGGMMTS